MRTGTLSVGSCHMDSLKRKVWMSKMFIQHLCIVETFFVSACSDVLEQGSAVEKVFDSLFIVH
jgi:hypothetical protein